MAKKIIAIFFFLILPQFAFADDIGTFTYDVDGNNSIVPSINIENAITAGMATDTGFLQLISPSAIECSNYDTYGHPWGSFYNTGGIYMGGYFMSANVLSSPYEWQYSLFVSQDLILCTAGEIGTWTLSYRLEDGTEVKSDTFVVAAYVPPPEPPATTTERTTAQAVDDAASTFRLFAAFVIMAGCAWIVYEGLRGMMGRNYIL